MSELASLGTPGRARGVDDRGQVVRARRRTPLLEVDVGDLGSGRDEHVEVVALEDVHALKVREAVAHGVDERCVCLCLHDDRDRPGVGEDPLDLRDRARLVHRDTDGPGPPDRVVQDGPLVASARHQSHAVADLHADGHEAARDTAHLVGELGRRDVGPASGRAPSQQGQVGRGGGVCDDMIGKSARRRAHEDRFVNLAHGLPPSVPSEGASDVGADTVGER